MFRLILISAFLYSSSLFADQSLIKVNGYCQNLAVNNVDLTKECGSEYHRVDYENGRVNYIFWVPNQGAVTFAGGAEESDGLNYLSRIEIDKVYVNDRTYPIKGSCSTLGNTQVGLTVSCRSQDTQRKFSALFFSYGKTEVAQ